MFFKKRNNIKAVKDYCKDILYSPAIGEVINLDDVNDEVFRTGMMGKGVAIKPYDNIVTSPISGKIITIFPTKHAIGIQGANGEELILHIGIETVALNGKYFEVLVKEGQYVDAGESLAEVEFKKIEGQGYDTTIIVVISNSQEFNIERICQTKKIEIQEPLLRIIRQETK